MSEIVQIRHGVYVDSVSLMQVSRDVGATPGVTAALVAMATELNLELMGGMGFSADEPTIPNDLIVAVRAVDDDALAAGLAAVDSTLAALRSAGASSGGFGAPPPPRTLRSAVRAGEANLALISVPGSSATAEAFDALDAGVSVMLFSDNVPVADEVALKTAAGERGLLVMGPDCGTAVVGGVALGFANAVRRGSVGLVAASGTGAQQVMCLLDAAGVGMSHCLGVGGRDLSVAVGGRSTLQALDALAADEATTSIVVVSKPPAAEVLAAVEEHAATLGRPPVWRGVDADAPVPGALRGLFCGGTLADEAMLVAAEALGDIASNIPLRPDLALGADLRSPGHVVIDFGDDSLTQGRAHPMIDPTLRMERIAAEAADPTCGVLLLDLVLGYGSHPDPAGELADAIGSARATAAADGRELPVVVSLTGVEGDPQGLTACAEALAAAGASVFVSNAAATRHAIRQLAVAAGKES